MTQLELFVIEKFAASGIRRQQHLETMVQGEAVDMIGANSASGAITRLEHRDRASCLSKLDRTRESRQPSADNDDIVRIACCCVWH